MAYIILWAWGHGFLDCIGNEAQHSTGGKEEGKSAGHVPEELDDLRGLLGRSEGIATPRVESGACLSIGQSLHKRERENTGGGYSKSGCLRGKAWTTYERFYQFTKNYN